MKNEIFQKQFLTSLGLAVSLLTNFHCNQPEKEPDPYENVEINKAFQKYPPLASRINVTSLSDKTLPGNLLFEATLQKEKVGADVLAILVGDSNKIVLHDDGKYGDKLAGDGVYSSVMNISTDSLGILLHDRLALGLINLSDKKKLYQFTGRMEWPANKEELDHVFNDANVKKSSRELMQAGLNILNPGIIDLLLPVSARFKQNSLVVTDPSVINDPSRTYNPCTNTGTPGGAWTFGKLMKEMANQTLTGIKPEDFVLNWMNTWKTDQTVNGDVISARPAIQSKVIDVWQTLSGGAGAPLDVNKAPFKLLAIVNRFDLRTSGSYGGGNAGEGRFVFCVTDQNCLPIERPNFLIIFEYGVNKTTCSQIHEYAQQWANLASLTLGSAPYNNALQVVTDQFTLAGTDPAKPNQNSLDQLRTNEQALTPGFPFWELREFHLDPTSHQLFNVTVKREPQVSFNGITSIPTPGVIAFGKFVNDNEETIIADNMDFPDNLNVSGSPHSFIAGHALTENPNVFHWDAIIAAGPGHIHNDTARMHISLNACSGCHGGETNNGNFFNIGFNVGTIILSPFLTGMEGSVGMPPTFTSDPFLVADRADRPSAAHPIQWPFNDLERRGRDLLNFLSSPCTIRFPPIRVTEENFFIPPGVPIELTHILTFKPVTMSD
jgi:hypothetical protein